MNRFEKWRKDIQLHTVGRLGNFLRLRKRFLSVFSLRAGCAIPAAWKVGRWALLRKQRFELNYGHVSSSDGAFDIRISELHRKGASNIGSVKVDMESVNAPIERVTRYFDQDNGIATHTFRFSGKFREAVANQAGAKLVFTRKAEIESDAWQMQKDSVLVDCVDNNGVFPLNAAQPELIQAPPPEEEQSTQSGSQMPVNQDARTTGFVDRPGLAEVTKSKEESVVVEPFGS